MASSPGAFLDLWTPLYGSRERLLQAHELTANLEELEGSAENKGWGRSSAGPVPSRPELGCWLGWGGDCCCSLLCLRSVSSHSLSSHCANSTKSSALNPISTKGMHRSLPSQQFLYSLTGCHQHITQKGQAEASNPGQNTQGSWWGRTTHWGQSPVQALLPLCLVGPKGTAAPLA